MPPAVLAAPPVARYRDRLDRALHAAFADLTDDAYVPLRYHLGLSDVHGHPTPAPQGKAVRPLLCLLLCEGLGGDLDHALPSAVAVEFLHAFTLMHDDVIDGAALRRHRPSVARVWGRSTAIVAGDLLFALAFQALLRGTAIPQQAHATMGTACAPSRTPACGRVRARFWKWRVTAVPT